MKTIDLEQNRQAKAQMEMQARMSRAQIALQILTSPAGAHGAADMKERIAECFDAADYFIHTADNRPMPEHLEFEEGD